MQEDEGRENETDHDGGDDSDDDDEEESKMNARQISNQ